MDKYTHGHHESVLRVHQWRTVANSAAFLLPYLAPDTKLLDVGCGPGTISAELSLSTPQGSVTAIDLSSDVIELAKREHSAADYPNLNFDTGDVYALNYPDNSFDIVYTHQVLQHLGKPIEALLEMKRVLRPGGIIAVRDADYGVFSWSPALAEFDAWMAIYQEVTRRNGATANGGRALKGWVSKAGFHSLEVSGSVWTFSTLKDRQWWGGAWAQRVLKSDFADQALKYGVADSAQLESISAAFMRWVADDEAVFFVPNYEVIARK